MKSVHMVCLLVGSRLVGWQFDVTLLIEQTSKPVGLSS